MSISRNQRLESSLYIATALALLSVVLNVYQLLEGTQLRAENRALSTLSAAQDKVIVRSMEVLKAYATTLANEGSYPGTPEAP